MGRSQEKMIKKNEKFKINMDWLNGLSLGHKLMLMQIVCVLLPLFITDSVVWMLIINAEKKETLQEMNNTADSVIYTLSDTIDNAANLAQSIHSNRKVNEFMKTDFASNLDYYERYVRFTKDSFYSMSINNSRCNTVIYGDNPGIVNGGYFRRLEDAVGTPWYRNLEESGKDMVVFADYANNGFTKLRVISIIRRMDYYHKGYEKSVLKLELNYSAISRDIMNAKYSELLYVCDGDTILFSNDGRGGTQVPFMKISEEKISNAGVHKTMYVYGNLWDVYIMTPKMDSSAILMENLLLILCLISVNIIVPFVLMRFINRSFTKRIEELDIVFSDIDVDELKQVPKISGHDEISALMMSYNRMAQRMNELIQTSYKNRLKSQEMDIARQKAELLVLRSQINPHFLFNALESIRMHSVIKKEFETADMVQKLALMERQNVELGNDFVQIRDEIGFVEAYMELQKYRFGERLTYDISVDEDCKDFWLPKLTLVTFVENACVHGMENKTAASWVFVRIYKENDELVMEIEDTGSGMPEEKCRQFVEEMSNVKIDMLKEKHHVGILNVALRLRLATDNKACFEMSSEIGAGTMVVISIPLDAVKQINK